MSHDVNCKYQTESLGVDFSINNPWRWGMGLESGGNSIPDVDLLLSVCLLARIENIWEEDMAVHLDTEKKKVEIYDKG